MAPFNRSLGWVAFADESVAYGTLGASLVYQHGLSVSPTYNEIRVVPPVLGSVAISTGLRLGANFSGSVTLAHTDEADEVGVIYNHLASVSGGVYTFSGTPTSDSLSLFYDLNGVEYDVAGCVASQISWTLNNQDISNVTVELIGRAPVKYAGAPRTPTYPPVSELVTPAALTTFTVGGDTVAGITGASITFSRQITGMERMTLGTSILRQPVAFDRPSISASFSLDLDDSTGNDTVSLIDDLLADATGFTIVLDNFSLTGCKVVGDMPELTRGLGSMNLRVMATSLEVTTS